MNYKTENNVSLKDWHKYKLKRPQWGFSMLFYHRLLFFMSSSAAFFALESNAVKSQRSKLLQSKYVMLQYSKNVETRIVTCDETHSESVNGLHRYPLTFK